MINSSIGYIICESASEPSAVLTPKLLNGKAIAEVILQTADERNRNGRYYSEEELFPQLTAPRTIELLESGTLRAECGHPLSKDLQRQSTIDDTKTCARFLKLWTEGKHIKAHVVGTNNELGRAFDLDLKEGCKPAWSLRALGSINQTRRGAEVKNLRLITWDNVIYPSHPGAYTQKLVTESGILLPGCDDSLSNTNMVYDESGIIIPITNDDVFRFIQTESSNLKFIKECFDFVYSGIQVNESGTKVLLTTYEGETLVVNIESYIHNELMDYASSYDKIRESAAVKENSTNMSYSFFDDIQTESNGTPVTMSTELSETTTDFIEENCDDIAVLTEIFGKKLPPIPAEMKLTDEDFVKKSVFKSKSQELIKFMKDNGYDNKKIGKVISSWYWAIVGVTFSSMEGTYEPKMSYMVELLNSNQYCNRKAIANDIQKTINSLERIMSKGTELNQKQKSWLADIKSASTKLKI